MCDALLLVQFSPVQLRARSRLPPPPPPPSSLLLSSQRRSWLSALLLHWTSHQQQQHRQPPPRALLVAASQSASPHSSLVVPPASLLSLPSMLMLFGSPSCCLEASDLNMWYGLHVGLIYGSIASSSCSCCSYSSRATWLSRFRGAQPGGRLRCVTANARLVTHHAAHARSGHHEGLGV